MRTDTLRTFDRRYLTPIGTSKSSQPIAATMAGSTSLSPRTRSSLAPSPADPSASTTPIASTSSSTRHENSRLRHRHRRPPVAADWVARNEVRERRADANGRSSKHSTMPGTPEPPPSSQPQGYQQLRSVGKPALSEAADIVYTRTIPDPKRNPQPRRDHIHRRQGPPPSHPRDAQTRGTTNSSASLATDQRSRCTGRCSHASGIHSRNDQTGRLADSPTNR